MDSNIVTPEWIHQNQKHSDIILLNCTLRSNMAEKIDQYEGKTIPNAIYFDIQNTFSDLSNPNPSMLVSPELFTANAQLLGINNTSAIIVYDNVGNYSSPRAKWMLNTMGHTNTYILDGGLNAWVKKGYPLESTVEKTRLKQGNFTSIFLKENIVSHLDIIENISSGRSILIDARSAGRFKGESPEPRAGIESGHIPGSVNLPFEQVLVDGQYKPKAELLQTFKNINPDNRPMIFTCGSGITACILLEASKLVGYTAVSLYDGAWVDWATKLK